MSRPTCGRAPSARVSTRPAGTTTSAACSTTWRRHSADSCSSRASAEARRAATCRWPSSARRRRATRRRRAPAASARVLLLANIHAGEVEGKEAALILARRLAGGDLRRLLDRVTVLVAPIYNADGNERVSVDNRPAQFGPFGGVGMRETARGLDLNRDFVKLEASRVAGAGVVADHVGPARRHRPAHHQRLVSRLSPDVRLDAGGQRRPAAGAGDPIPVDLGPAGAGRPRLAQLLVRQLRRRRGARSRADPARIRARPPGARSTRGRGLSPTASACATASRFSRRRTATCRSNGASESPRPLSRRCWRWWRAAPRPSPR